jgi:hypothetical protein
MKRELQLYIQNTRVDLFKDETVSLTDSIQNVRDISKVFTSFTKTFTLPASATNNLLFQHYYNFDIVSNQSINQSGFDARKKVTARIEINHAPYKTGKIKLEGVDLKNNQPYAYKITFFGDIVEIKDALGDKKLADLDFSAYDLTYNPSTVETKLTNIQSSTNHIIAPLITHTQRLFFNSDTSSDVADNGDLHYHSGGGQHIHGVKWNQLKYAIRVNKIIEAIEALTEFDFTFSTDFFKNTSKPEFDHLFLWLHRKKGAVEQLTDSPETKITGLGDTTGGADPVGDYNFRSSVNDFLVTVGTDFVTIREPEVERMDRFKLEIDVATGETDPYSLRVTKDGSLFYQKNNITGDFIVEDDSLDEASGSEDDDWNYEAGTYEVFITPDNSGTVISIDRVVWGIRTNRGTDSNLFFRTPAIAIGETFTFYVDRQMPDMKIIDFLAGLFQMFNLTAFLNNNVIKVQPLNDFYAGGTSYDITEYLDINTSQVNVALPFREIVFKFKDTKTFIADRYGKINGQEWSEIKYKAGETQLAGEIYKVEVPFGHMQFERLNDVTGGTLKNIQWGYYVDSNQEPYIGSPMLFYPININTGGISFVDALDVNGVASSHKELTNVNLPFNSVDENPAVSLHQLNFNLEFSEWTRTTEFTKSLFQEYYSAYISQVFDSKNRLTKIKARLPLKILLNYSLADKFVINGTDYRINSITTNLTTGEADIELLNI